MRHELTQTQIDSYRKNGFLVIENVLDRDELEEWRRCTEEAVQQQAANAGIHNQGDPDAFYAQVFIQALQLANVHEGMRKLMHDRRLGKMAATLAGVDGVRIWHDQALLKQPFGNPTAWHLDNPYWSFSSRDSLSLWMALDDATLSNGCMYYMPGTHQVAEHDRNVSITQNMAGLFKAYPEWRQINPVACPCPAGSAVWHNGLTAHGAGANMTNKPRRAMTCGYMPDGSTFNGTQNILPKDYFESLKVGDALNDDARNPLIWSSKWQ